jgi:phosphotransferase system  glucose/maltose/N-acetylglucosamine-specific IIC component
VNTEDKTVRLSQQLRIAQLREQLWESRGRKFNAMMPGAAVVFIIACAGAALAVILAAAMKALMH